MTLKFQLGSEESGSALVIPAIVMATTDTRDMDMGIIREATTATTAAIHITERITPGGRTTTEAIEFTSIIRIITTATKAGVGAKKNWLAWSNSKPAFLVPCVL